MGSKFTRCYQLPHSVIQKVQGEGEHPTHSMKLELLWFQIKPKTLQEKKWQANCPHSIVTQTLHKVLLNQNPQHLAKIIHRSQAGFMPRVQGWFNICKSIDAICYINTPSYRHRCGYVSISTDAGESFDKIQHPGMI